MPLGHRLILGAHLHVKHPCFLQKRKDEGGKAKVLRAQKQLNNKTSKPHEQK
jgi:hypothetical protein